jgi:hypothetical protein
VTSFELRSNCRELTINRESYHIETAFARSADPLHQRPMELDRYGEA